jgi:hypothetical protein
LHHLNNFFIFKEQAMNFDPASFEHIDFDLGKLNSRVSAQINAIESAIENTVVETIVMGSGGPDNKETTEAGLRFVRHLLANSKSMRFGFMPNLKDMNNIRNLAQDFIASCGNGPLALETMYQVIQPQ